MVVPDSAIISVSDDDVVQGDSEDVDALVDCADYIL